MSQEELLILLSLRAMPKQSKEADKKQEFGRAREAVTNLLKAANDGDVSTLKACVDKQAEYDKTDAAGVLSHMSKCSRSLCVFFRS